MSGRQRSGAAIGAGGLLVLAGTQLHPHDGAASVHETLAQYFRASTWDVSHLLILVGLWVTVAGLLLARRDGVFDPRLRRQLLVTATCWALVSIELVPHLLARHDLDALQHHGETPVLDLHLVLGAVATPLFGLTAALLAVALAVTGRTWPAALLAVPGVLGGVAYAFAGPLIYLTDNVAFAPLFAGQGLVALFLVGTGIRMLARTRTDADDREPVSDTVPA